MQKNVLKFVAIVSVALTQIMCASTDSHMAEYRLGWNMDEHVPLSMLACAALIALAGNASSHWVEWPIRRRGLAYTQSLLHRRDAPPMPAP